MVEYKIDSLWIHAGELDYYYLDDVSKPFKVNPDFNYYVPYPNSIGCWLYIDKVNKPKLFFYTPKDYWVESVSLPNEFWIYEFEIIEFENVKDLIKFIKPTLKNSVYIGENVDLARQYGFDQINSHALLEYLHYYRAYKTEFEIECIRMAQQISFLGHKAAKKAFDEGCSEFEIHLEFLKATLQKEEMTPYRNIVAINNHGSILHYTNYRNNPPTKKYSFLLDAGSSKYGWTSDITRTFSTKQDEFQELINFLDTKQQQIISELKLETNYVDYHFKMHYYIADILIEFDLVKLNKEELLAYNITSIFFPHGLGHLLGLKCHDLSGHVQNHKGCLVPPPQLHSSLRCTRMIKPNMVFTIEPGIYFIEMLLKPWENHKLTKYFNWTKINNFYKYGGVRIEDDIFLDVNGKIENMTRDVFEKF